MESMRRVLPRTPWTAAKGETPAKGALREVRHGGRWRAWRCGQRVSEKSGELGQVEAEGRAEVATFLSLSSLLSCAAAPCAARQRRNPASRKGAESSLLFEGEAGGRAGVRRIPGDGCRRKSGGVPVALYPPEESALGEGWGVWGEGNTLARQPRPKAAAGRARCDEGSYGHRQQR